MAALIGLFLGAFVGHMLWRDWGAALGGIAGFIIGAKLNAWRAPPGRHAPTSASRSTPAVSGESARGPAVPEPERTLLERLAELERRVTKLERASGGEEIAEQQVSPDATLLPLVEANAPGEDRGTAIAASPAQSAPSAERPPGATPTDANRLWAWFTGGNALTRIGVVVLFFGVAFLLRYFAERFSFRIELRLAAVAACGFALVGLGWRLAASRPGYGLSLQGAGAGILYLTTYAAFRLYGVLAAAPTIALLAGVSALTVWLAVRNESQPLAALAIAGGFLAPMLVATGGEPLYLFVYFAVLNSAIFALAWARAWRGLNVVGFVFTFVLAAVWGHGFYRPEHYAVVQPFLVLFFAFYVGIAILYARRGPLVARDPVDGLLVFGVPLVGFALQAAIVHDTRYGVAWSALAMAAVYASLFVTLRRRSAPGFALLCDAFLALAVIFTTIAIPFALDNRATAALWAVEAAGVYWIGMRQHSRLARAFGLVVQWSAGIAFAVSGVGDDGDRLFANAFFAGAMLIAVSGLVTARIADRAGDALPAAERWLARLVLAWGAIWWLGAGGVELYRQLPRTGALHPFLAWVTASVAAALGVAGWLSWPGLARASVALLPVMTLVALGDFERARTTLTHYGWLVWPFAWLVHWLALRRADSDPAVAGPAATPALPAERVLRAAHSVSALMFVTQAAWEASEWTGRATALDTAWTPCAAALPAIAFLWLCVRFRDSPRWPAVPYREAYVMGAGGPVVGLLGVWFLTVNALSPGDPSPLPYFPVANPLDVTLALALLALFAWAKRFGGISEASLYRWLGGGLFVALNGIVLRTAHQWADVPWRLSSLLASKPLQAALTLSWTLTALGSMVVATRRRLRPLWMLGAALLAVVVGKLFVIDLSALSGLPRVVAFLGVGILLLVVGFLSPLPPAGRQGGSGDGAAPRA